MCARRRRREVFGFIAALAEQGPTRGPQNVFVNRRIVKDRTIAHAIMDSYSVASIKERSPEVHLFIEMPPDAVDVNVHPTKAEVRFRDQSHIHELIRRTLGDALGRGPAPELQLEAPRGFRPTAVDAAIAACVPASFPSRWNRTAHHRTVAPVAPTSDSGIAPTDESGLAPATDPSIDRRSAGAIRPMMPLGQFRDTFIIAVDEEGIAIIDQHVAHERVLFERIMERLTSGTARKPAPAGADAGGAVARRTSGAHSHAQRISSGSGSRSKSSAATRCA